MRGGQAGCVGSIWSGRRSFFFFGLLLVAVGPLKRRWCCYVPSDRGRAEGCRVPEGGERRRDMATLFRLCDGCGSSAGCFSSGSGSAKQ